MLSELPPSHQLLLEPPGEGVFRGGKGTTLLPSQRGETYMHTDHERQSKRGISCPLPAACLRSPSCPVTQKHGKKSNPRRWKSWCRAQHAKPQHPGQEAMCSTGQGIALQRSSSRQGFLNPLPTHPEHHKTFWACTYPGNHSLSTSKHHGESRGKVYFAL